MNLGRENETLEFKKTTGEVNAAMDDIVAILNKHGAGELYFGVKPNGDVAGQEIGALTLDDIARVCKDAIKPMIYLEIEEVELDGASCIRVRFSGTERPYSSFGRYYLRVNDRSEPMSPEALKSMMASTDYSSRWENNPTRYGVEDVSAESLLRFYNKAISCGRMEPLPAFNASELLMGLGLCDGGVLTNAGYYLFSNKKPIVLKMATYVTDERISFSDIRRVEGNIYDLIDIALSYVKEKMSWRVESGADASRIEVPEIPVEALREIVVNAFAHADYRGRTEHEISVTPTQIEIYNPGEFPMNLTPESFVKERRKSQPRNRVIVDTLFKSKEVEAFGSGFRKVYSLCKAANVGFSFDNTEDGFSFVFHRSANVTINDTINVTINLTGTDLKVLSILKETPIATREEIVLDFKSR